MTRSTKYGVTGRKYILSANPSEVCTVAMLGLIRTVAMPSSLRALRGLRASSRIRRLRRFLARRCPKAALSVVFHPMLWGKESVKEVR